MRLRGWHIDVLSGGLATVASLILVPHPVFLLVGASMAAVRRWPGPILAMLALVVVVSTSSKGVPVGVTLVLLLVALGVLAYRSGWVAIALGWAVAFGAMLTIIDPSNMVGRTLAFIVAGEAGLAAGAVVFGRYLRGVRHVAEIAEQRATEAQLWRGVETRAARLAERSRLARDLHDIVAHHVGAMTLRASSGRLALDTSGDTAAARAALADVATAGRQVLDELRGLLTVLRDPDAIDDEPLVTEPKAAMADAVARVRAAGVPVNLDLDPRLGDVSLLVRATVARIVQEALTNVLKHAGPGTATRLTTYVEPPGTVRVEVVNGPGGRPAIAAALPSSGHGLAGMRDRVALMGGVLIAGPTPDRGWSVTATLPAPPVEGDRE